MRRHPGDTILVLRRAAGLTQEELAERVGIRQATLSRYEHNLRPVDEEAAERLAPELGVTVEFLLHEFQMQGAVAADAHMRRHKTAKPSEWKRIEARLNVIRMHSAYLLDRVPLRPQNQVPQFDPDETSPAEAAAMLRTAWRMPIGAVRDLVRWVESAGVIVLEEDFGTAKIDGMSQWAGDHAVILVNSARPTDRQRLTIAHELGHLVLHTGYFGVDVEEQANEFAANFLMPEQAIRPDLRNLSLGRLTDVKVAWGVSMQALYERAYQLGMVTKADRTDFYRQLSKRGWRTREPKSDLIPPETPRLARSIGESLENAGLSRSEVARLVGTEPSTESPFLKPEIPLRRLQVI